MLVKQLPSALSLLMLRGCPSSVVIVVMFAKEISVVSLYVVPASLLVAFDVNPEDGCPDPSKPVDNSVSVAALATADVSETESDNDSANIIWVESSDDESKNP